MIFDYLSSTKNMSRKSDSFHLKKNLNKTPK